MRTEEEIEMKRDELSDLIEDESGMKGNTIIARIVLEWVLGDEEELEIL